MIKYLSFFRTAYSNIKLQKMTRRDFSLFFEGLIKFKTFTEEEIENFENSKFSKSMMKVDFAIRKTFGIGDLCYHCHICQSKNNHFLMKLFWWALLASYPIAFLMASPKILFQGIEKRRIVQPLNMKLFTLVNFFYSSKTVNEIFNPIIADWQLEYFEALFKNEIWKARCINVRYTYAFVIAMWQKSPIGDLIEFVIKIAKQ